MSEQEKGLKQRYYGNIYNLSFSSPVLLWDNFQFEHVATGERFQTKILTAHLHFKPLYASVTSW